MDETMIEDSLESFAGSFMGETLGAFLGIFMQFFIIFLVVGLVLYILIAIFLNKYNKLVYGKGTPLAFIPICNVYLLGKLTVNKLVGWLLVLVPLLTGTTTTEINGVETTHTLLPPKISQIISTVYGVTVFILLIYGIVQYFQLKKANKIVDEAEKNNQEENNNQNVYVYEEHQNKEPLKGQNTQINNNFNTQNIANMNNVNTNTPNGLNVGSVPNNMDLSNNLNNNMNQNMNNPMGYNNINNSNMLNNNNINQNINNQTNNLQ